VGPFEMVVLIVFFSSMAKLGSPVARALAHRISRGPGTDSPEVPALRAALSATEERLAQAEDRITDLDEKLRFVEGLLSKPERAPELPAHAPGRPAGSTAEGV
jgi:hypothetical protein